MFERISPFFLVGIGGLVGSICRYSITLLLAGVSSIATPFGTFTSNIAGCLIVGIITEIATVGELISPATRLLLATGFCGGFTTLSSLIHELALMIKAGHWLYALLYLNGTLIGAALAFLLGAAFVKASLRFA